MGLLDVRRLAAIDMHGVAGTRRRRRVILAEFALGAVVGVFTGVWVAVSAGPAGWQVFGAWVAGIGINYAALAWHAVSLSRPGALDAELVGVRVAAQWVREMRRVAKTTARTSRTRTGPRQLRRSGDGRLPLGGG